MPTGPHHRQNALLASLAPGDLALLEPCLELVALPRGRMLADMGEPQEQVWFPHDCVVSCTVAMIDGRMADAAMIGREGMVGTAVVLGDRSAIARSMVQVGGWARCIAAARLEAAVARSPALAIALLRYASALTGHIVQLSACNSLHKVDARLCRCLLMLQDRTGLDELQVTHEFLSEMLGVRRPTVTLTAGALQAAGLIHYRQGALQIADRAGLEAVSCECYATINARYERLLPGVFAGPGPVPASVHRHGSALNPGRL